ncbi:Miniconductance mechanosensitive channel YbdG [compost metagenome]
MWADYERIQGDIFDYLLSVMPEFGLSLYQQPSGNDLRASLLPASLPRAQRTLTAETADPQ